MAVKYRPYPAYKPSGVEWLGDIPEEWEVKPLKHIAIMNGRIGFRGYTTDDIVGEGEGAIVLSPSNVQDEKFSLAKLSYLSWKKYFESPEIIVNLGDILLVKTGSTFGKSTYVNAVHEPMTINPQMLLIKTKTSIGKFVAYLFNSRLIQSTIEVSNTGSGMPTMTQENIGQLPVPCGCISEMKNISAFLDHETVKIDGLIAKQQRLIALLEEKRQAVISHAATKGLDPSAPLRPSGIDWLGDVPAHWEVKPIKFVCSSIGTGSTPKEKDDLADKGDVPWFTPGDFDGQSGLKKPEKWLKDASFAKGTAKQFSRNSVLIVGIGATLGKIAVCEQPFSGNQQINVATPNERNSVHFLASALANQLEQMKTVSNSATIGIMNQEKTGSILIAVPPSSEQLEIVNYVADKAKSFAAIHQQAQSAITLLKERRTALISAAVTGKIDLRDWQASDIDKNEEVLA